jgi:MinD superfamily P-loop ATPase
VIVSVASGKGGTGKTTVATSLAASLDTAVQILDCDVEEPNCHLFVKPKWEHRETVTTFVPKIDEGRCTFCGKCAALCQFKAIVVLGSTTLVFPELCHGCEGCREVCSEGAVAEEARELGFLERGRRNGIELVQGRLRIGEAMAPPLIKRVRAQADPSAAVIIDAPPGTSCPMIASVRNTDFVLLVTEPTPFGLHDLMLAVEAIEVLKLPCGLVINRSDLGNDEVYRYAEQKNIPILMEIPFDRKIAESYAQGGILAEVLPKWKERFQELWEKIALHAKKREMK